MVFLLMKREDIIPQLIKIYMTEEWWHKQVLSLEESWKYFKFLITKDKIICKVVDDKVVGYVEFFFVTPAQVEKLNNENFFTFNENIDDGDVCYINNIWVDDSYRGNGMLASFKSQIEKKKDFKYYAGNDVNDNNSLKTRRK